MDKSKTRFSRCALVVLIGLAWLSSSEHCALGALLRSPGQIASTMAHCHPDQSAPAQHPNQSEMPCCRTLRATVATQVTISGATARFFLPLPLWAVVDLPSLKVRARLAAIEFDTGPPDSYSFPESVLQRSLLAHAPPFLS